MADQEDSGNGLLKTNDVDGDDFSASSKFPQAGSRPVTTRPTTSGRTRGPVRPVTSMTSRPGTSMVPEWMYQEEANRGEQRPKTGYRPEQVSGVDRLNRQTPIDWSRPASGRLGSAMARPGSSVGGGVRGVPGTASRLLETAARCKEENHHVQHFIAISSGSGQQVSVAERPITQQGLQGLKTGGGRGPQRQFQDKSYFLGALRTKMTELTSEISRLTREVEAASEEQGTYLAYDKRVKELAAELTLAQGQLADYNLLVDKLNTDTERAEVEAECQELKAENDLASQEVEALWAEKQAREAQIQQLEVELEQERHMADSLVGAMKPELRDRFMQLKSANVEYARAMEEMNQELDVLASRKAVLEDEMAVSAVKREAVGLYEQLAAAEARKEELQAEARERGTPQQERERLLAQVKEDNEEISMMERQIVEAQEKARSLTEARDQLDQDLEENQSERNQKYRELKKREETMDQFLQTFDDTKEAEQQKLTELEGQISSLLEGMSRNLVSVGHLPTSQVFGTMKEDLAFKEGEVEKSRNTLDGLNREHQQLTMNLEKIEALEDKIKTEMTTLKEKMGRMEEEMVTFSDLDRLRQEAEEKRQRLEEERSELQGRREGVLQAMEESQKQLEEIKKALSDNDTHIQLSNLERRWQVAEQNNFAISEFINNKKAESNYEPIKNKVLKLQWEYNKMLIEALKKN